MARSRVNQRTVAGFISPGQAAGDSDSLEESNSTDYVEVLCINCQDMISIDLIELHSKSCTQVTARVLQLEELDQIDSALQRIRNLLKFLTPLRHQPQLKTGDKMYVEMLLEKTQGLIASTPDIASYEDYVTEILQSLTSLLVTFKGSNCILIYTERLKILVGELLKAFRERELMRKRQEIFNIQQQIEAEKEKIKKIPVTRYLPLEAIEETEEPKAESEEVKFPLSNRSPREGTASKPVIRNQIADVNSDMGSIKSSSVFSDSPESSTGRSSDLMAPPEIGALVQKVPQLNDIEVSSQTEEEKRRKFYTLCLQAKFSYSADHLAQNIQISGLYKRAIRKNVEEADWPQFITTELDNAAKWVKKNKRERR